jgi:hypothetical protein
MQLTMTVDEVIALATASSPLPPIVRSLSAEGEVVRAELDPLEVITGSLARIVAAAAGTISVVARFARFSEGVASFDITAMARGLPAHKLLPLLLDRVNSAIAENPSIAGIVTIEDGTEQPRVLVDLHEALSTRVPGMRVTGFDLRDATFHLDATVS